ncbi:MAG TPA: hypothetical protein PK585_02730 [Amphiplicatus sp.]|nr:hypothetical protein [Amphiplicatus sp.]
MRQILAGADLKHEPIGFTLKCFRSKQGLAQRNNISLHPGESVKAVLRHARFRSAFSFHAIDFLCQAQGKSRKITLKNCKHLVERFDKFVS